MDEFTPTPTSRVILTYKRIGFNSAGQQVAFSHFLNLSREDANDLFYGPAHRGAGPRHSASMQMPLARATASPVRSKSSTKDHAKASKYIKEPGDRSEPKLGRRSTPGAEAMFDFEGSDLGPNTEAEPRIGARTER